MNHETEVILARIDRLEDNMHEKMELFSGRLRTAETGLAVLKSECGFWGKMYAGIGSMVAVAISIAVEVIGNKSR